MAKEYRLQLLAFVQFYAIQIKKIKIISNLLQLWHFQLLRPKVQDQTQTQRRNRAQATGLNAPKINLSNITINKI